MSTGAILSGLEFREFYYSCSFSLVFRMSVVEIPVIMAIRTTTTRIKIFAPDPMASANMVFNLRLWNQK